MDAYRARLLAHEMILRALLESHPNKAELLYRINKHSQELLDQLVNSPASEQEIDAIREHLNVLRFLIDPLAPPL